MTNVFRNSKEAILDIYTTHGVESAGDFDDVLFRNIRTTLESVGVSPESNLRTARLGISKPKGEVELPNGIHYIYEVYLQTKAGPIVMPGYGGSEMKFRANDFFNRSWHDRPRTHGLPMMGIQDTCMFFMEGNPDDYECAYLAYTGLRYDCYGNLMYPFYCDYAVGCGLDAKLLQIRARRGERISAQALQDANALWHNAIGDARGESKMPDPQEIYTAVHNLMVNPLASHTMPKRIFA